MRYLFAAVIAVFAITADLESSNNHSIWVEPSFVIAAAQSGGWRWPLFMIGYMTVLAYSASLLVYQVGSRLGCGL